MATLIASCCWSRAGDLNRRSSGILLSPVRNCLARSVSRASWRCVAAHSSRHVIFVVAPSSVFSRVAVVYVFWAQGSNTIRAQSTCQKLSLSVPIMGPLLVPRFGAKKMSPHSISDARSRDSSRWSRSSIVQSSSMGLSAKSCPKYLLTSSCVTGNWCS